MRNKNDWDWSLISASLLEESINLSDYVVRPLCVKTFYDSKNN